MRASPLSIRNIRSLPREGLESFVAENVRSLLEDEAQAVLDNQHCRGHICEAIARVERLTSFYSVRLRLVSHRATPRGVALKFVHHLYWRDLLRLSVDVSIAAPVRRAIDVQMLLRVPEVTIGDRISTARTCSAALIKHFLADPDERIFRSLLVNPRLREEDLAVHTAGRATAGQVSVLAADFKWSQRRSIRRAIVLNASSPRAIAASQLPHLSRYDLRAIYRDPGTSTYLRRCIERLRGVVELDLRRVGDAG